VGAKSESESRSVKFDGQVLSGYTAEKSAKIRITGHCVQGSEAGKILVIRGGLAFIPGTYRIVSVDRGSNSWILHHLCATGPASNMIGEYIFPRGGDYDEVAEYFDPTLPKNAGQSVARQRVREVLNALEPGLLSTLARTCFKTQLLKPPVTDVCDWSGPVANLQWGHVKSAGQIVPSIGVAFGNLGPLKTALVRWAKDEPERRWNLCDNDGEPLNWLAEPAVWTLVWWEEKGCLPKLLQWEDFELFHYRPLGSPQADRMFELERHFDAGAGYYRIAPQDGVEFSRLSYRAQRAAKQEYDALGVALHLETMPRIALRHIRWYVLRTFLGLKLREIRERERQVEGLNLGDPEDPDDFSAISHGIRTVADLVDFRPSSLA